MQGFDRGTFGGNFHTHNALPFCGAATPGLTVVSYSNGHDWVRGWRACVEHARDGGVVMLVDCTELLNERHLFEKGDRLWEMPYAKEEGTGEDIMHFDDVTVHKDEKANPSTNKTKIGIVTYGNGVLTSLRARQTLTSHSADSELCIDVIDTPLISRVSAGMTKILPQYDAVIFADICKGGGGSGAPLSGIITELKKTDELPKYWGVCNAANTYNPLGDLSTFLSVRDIAEACQNIIKTINIK